MKCRVVRFGAVLEPVVESSCKILKDLLTGREMARAGVSIELREGIYNVGYVGARVDGQIDQFPISFK